MKLHNKKAGMEIPATLLCLFTIVLLITSLTTFYTRERKLENKIFSSNSLEVMYAEAETLDFYLDEIVKKIDANTQQGAIALFKTEIANYKDNSGNYFIVELKQIEDQLNEEHITLEDNKLSFNFQILFTKRVYDTKNQEKLVYEASYNHIYNAVEP